MTEIFEEELRQADADGLRRVLNVVESAQGRAVEIGGRELLLFSSNNYLGLATHPSVVAAAVETTEKYGWGSGASRLISGTMAPHMEFEQKAAAFLDKEAALLYASGYATNLGVLTAIAGRGDTVYADRLAHASLLDGARHSGARLKRFRHNDPDSLRGLISRDKSTGRKIIVTEGVFSMDGDFAPLREIAEVAEQTGAIFMVDDAHGFGLFGPDGRGRAHEEGVMDRVDVYVATLGKAMGGAGGFVAGSRTLIDGLVNFSRPFIYSTAPVPAVAGAGSAALDVVSGPEGEARRRALGANSGKIVDCLENMGYNISDGRLHIVPVFMNENKDLRRLSRKLVEMGVFIPAIRPPTVPKGTERFRLSVMADHTAGDIDKLGDAFEKLKTFV